MARGWRVGIVVATVALTGCAQAPPEEQVLIDAAEAMGGARALREATSLVVEGKGRSYRLGQNKNPDADLPYYEVGRYTRTVDLENGRMRVDLERTSAYYTGSPVYGQQVISGLDGNVAFSVNEEGEQQRGNDQALRDRLVEMYHHPVTLIQPVLKGGTAATVANLRQEGGFDVVDVTAPTGDTFTIHVDAETKLPARITSHAYDPNLGDVLVTTELSDYAETGGLGGFGARLTLPRKLTTRVDRFMFADWTVASNINAEIEDLAASASVQSAPAPAYQANVQAEEVAPGVWALGGQSHHSVLVRFPAYAVLIEAPQHDGRTLAVIEQARALLPDTPLRYVINTHHHFDHSGGVRAAVAEGLTLVTHELNRPFFEDIVNRPHTRMADHLSQKPGKLDMQLVSGDDKFELRDGNRVLEVYRIRDDLHNDGILMVYLPAERILIEADAFASNAAEAPFAANLLKNIRDRGLRVDRIIAIHGPVTTIQELEAAAKTGGARTE